MTQTEIEVLLSDAEQSLHQQFSALDKIEQVNFARVMDAFRAEQVAVRHFAPTTWLWRRWSRHTGTNLRASFRLRGCTGAPRNRFRNACLGALPVRLAPPR